MSRSLFSLDDRVVVLTGAAGLLGRHHAQTLADAGAAVVAADLDAAGCRDLMETLPGSHLAVEVDVTEPESVRRLAKLALDRYGRVDALINNAARNDMFERPDLAELSRFENYPLEQWQRSLDVNLTGMFLVCQAVGTAMAERGSGSIVNIASTYAMVGPDQRIYHDGNGPQTFYKSPAYPATKGAVLSFTRFLAAYWGERGVRVNALSPGGVENGQEPGFVHRYSDRTPLGRMARPTDYAGALVFLCSDASAYMTGANLVVDGGWTAW